MASQTNYVATSQFHYWLFYSHKPKLLNQLCPRWNRQPTISAFDHTILIALCSPLQNIWDENKINSFFCNTSGTLLFVKIFLNNIIHSAYIVNKFTFLSASRRFNAMLRAVYVNTSTQLNIKTYTSADDLRHLLSCQKIWIYVDNRP